MAAGGGQDQAQAANRGEGAMQRAGSGPGRGRNDAGQHWPHDLLVRGPRGTGGALMPRITGDTDISEHGRCGREYPNDVGPQGEHRVTSVYPVETVIDACRSVRG